MEKLKIGISIGDINGIGLEVILKTLNHERIQETCVPIIYGSSKVVSYHKNITGIDDFHFQPLKSTERIHTGKVNVVNCWDEVVNITLGQATEDGGKYAFLSLEKAVSDLKHGILDALVTGPINKKAMQMASFPYPGHTEYLTTQMGESESLMMMVNGGLRIGVATNHIPLKDVANSITKELITTKLKVMAHTLKKDFGIDRPTIAVLGLNPHASDGSIFGDEEEKIIRPAIVQLKKGGMIINGPFPADGFFGSSQFKKYDAILAMYHDQGLIPFKTLSFGSGVNFTAGLSFIRTSPDHGTAYDLAGQNAADPSSFRNALFLAIDVSRNRKEYFENRENALVKKNKLKSENDGDPAPFE
ncbi:4-hydroxythreonine-4-phosphate dehydrogenase PdxA [Saprospiraceae bacterium]|jgi:4-hydroxythreonine-4-phosphate dehydrogenase|nr:4-hydroxythreonine-4-phosphate dehydrogenase PdxA [Bacteroidota bacterium]MDB4728318.1 4-hydroxythreonine-4-phosphate dehydrogenase PdxA [Saprospiraceae bacterium]MDF1863475.1 4-hydroxythreonine-4-phosphate dehydrogenase PdxA [Saprospiraceae bacterium]